MSSARRRISRTRCWPRSLTIARLSAMRLTAAPAPSASTGPALCRPAMAAKNVGRSPVCVDSCKIVALAQPRHQRQRFAGVRALREREDFCDIGIAGQNSFGAGKYQGIDRSSRERPLDAANKRSGQQHIAKPPQRHDQHPGGIRQCNRLHCDATEALSRGNATASLSTDRPRKARTRLPPITSSSLAWFAGNCERSFGGCHKCNTPVANRPSLRRTPACRRRTTRSESSRPQPV